jgi:hypothetical protein
MLVLKNTENNAMLHTMYTSYTGDIHTPFLPIMNTNKHHKKITDNHNSYRRSTC